LDAFAPDVVINCVGIVKQRREAAESIPSIEINALAPHKISGICKDRGIRFIHVSTDCVFDGKTGGYKESDPCNVSDIYGLTKYLGEVHESNAITLRTSIIGHELSRKTGLLDWFLAQTDTVKGFKNAIFSGLTTRELAAVIDMLVTSHPDACGLYHVSSDPINKFDLLRLFKEVYARSVEIEEDVSFYCDRSLNSARFQEHFDYKSPAWRDMVIAMRDDFEGRPSGF
jgi:dTDP-4-dehydrorhamnose reductase